MKPYLFILPLIVITHLSNSQIQIKPYPVTNYEKRITDFVDSLKIVDTHEHLMSQENLMKTTSLDFTLLFKAYATQDLHSAGMPGTVSSNFFRSSTPVKEKWEILKPYWEATFNTSFCRIPVLVAKKLFDINDINESTVEELSEKIRRSYKTDWIKYVITNKCNIEFLIQDKDDKRTLGNDNIRYLARFDNFINVKSKLEISTIAEQQDAVIHDINDYINCLNTAFNNEIKKGIVGVKSALAYRRTLFYEDVKKERAEMIFNSIISPEEGNNPSDTDIKAFQDFIMHKVLDLASTNYLPVAFHTGYVPGNDINNSNPTLLINLFRKYPDLNFVIYHGGYPFGGELATVAKNFRNVYIDLCWLYVISPSYSERYLHEWLETVPVTKIMGFGGDYNNIELVYGHLCFAKQVLSKVLADKVKDGYISESEAKDIARMILHDNALKLYKLK